jgi:hypothetical protein
MNWVNHYQVKRKEMLEAVASIKHSFTLCKLDLKDCPWLFKAIREVEQIGNGVSFSVNAKNLEREQWMKSGLIFIVLVFAKDLKTCLEKGIDVKEKLIKIKTLALAAGTLHEIHCLACLLRANQNSNFVKESKVKTPDIDIENIGFIECKTATTKKAVVRALGRSIEQLKNSPGIRFTEVLLFFPIPKDEVEDVLKDVFTNARKYGFALNTLHGFSLTFFAPSYEENGDLTFGIYCYGQPIDKLTLELTRKIIFCLSNNK